MAVPSESRNPQAETENNPHDKNPGSVPEPAANRTNGVGRSSMHPTPIPRQGLLMPNEARLSADGTWSLTKGQGDSVEDVLVLEDTFRKY